MAQPQHGKAAKEGETEMAKIMQYLKGLEAQRIKDKEEAEISRRKEKKI